MRRTFEGRDGYHGMCQARSAGHTRCVRPGTPFGTRQEWGQKRRVHDCVAGEEAGPGSLGMRWGWARFFSMFVFGQSSKAAFTQGTSGVFRARGCVAQIVTGWRTRGLRHTVCVRAGSTLVTEASGVEPDSHGILHVCSQWQNSHAVRQGWTTASRGSHAVRQRY